MRVVVIGDIRLFCEGLAHYLRRVPGITVAGTAKSKTEALSKCRSLEPDIALVDMAMPDSMGAVRELGEAVEGTVIVGISVPDEGGAVIACAEAGVSAYVAREGSLDDLAETLKSVMRGEAPVSPRIAAALLRRIANTARGGGSAAATETSLLTEREAEVAGLVGDGLTNKQIARRLRIRLPTVKNHVHNILEKLNVSRRTQIAGRLADGDRGMASGPHDWSRSDPDPRMHPAWIRGTIPPASSGADPAGDG